MPNPNASPLAPHRPGEVLVQFDDSMGLAFRGQALAQVGGAVADRLLDRGGVGELTRVTLGKGVTVEHAIEILSRMNGVRFAEPDYILGIEAVSNDTAVAGGQTWGLYGDVGSPANAYGSQATEAWAAGFTGGTKVAVGMIDSGVDYTHPDLYQNIWLNQREIPTAIRAGLKDVDSDGLITFRDLNNTANASYVSDRNANARIDAGDLLNDARWEDGADEDGNGYADDLIGWDFVNNDNDPMDDHGHGTHVSGTIAATGGNGAGVAGVAWSAQVVALKFLDAAGSGYGSNSVKAIDYFTNQAKAAAGVDFAATNNSWGGGGASQATLDAITRGAQQQVLFVAAAGNGGADQVGDNNDAVANYPSNYSTLATAGYEAVIGVAAITNTGALASYSNYGDTTVDLGAPGSGIYSTTRGGGYGYMSGTSMATPHVTGAIALYSAAAPAASAAKIRTDLLGSTIHTASLDGKVASDGRLDVQAFLARSGASPAPSPGGVSVTGTAGADLITPTATAPGQAYPGASADTLAGLAGNDTLDGGAGADRMEGGPANDTYYVDNVGDQVIETEADGGGGVDIVRSTVSFTLGANVERLALLGTGAISGVGNEVGNYLVGNAGANQLSGLGGGDYLRGYDGADTLNGGAGADRLQGGPGADRFVLARGQAAGDIIDDFGADDVLQLSGYAAGSTIARVAGSTTSWVITDGATHATETITLANAYSLGSGDFLFG
jgi:subtilisin family serine protease